MYLSSTSKFSVFNVVVVPLTIKSPSILAEPLKYTVPEPVPILIVSGASEISPSKLTPVVKKLNVFDGVPVPAATIFPGDKPT